MGDPAPRSIPAHQCRPDLPTIPSPLSLRIAPTTPITLALRNHLVYTRDTLPHVHPPPPCSPASSDSSPPWRPLHSSPGPRICGRSYSLYRWERVGVRVFRATTPGLRKGLSWRPAPACFPSFVGAGPKPASSVRDPSTPTPRRVRALSVPPAPPSRPRTAPTLVANPPKNPAQAISRQPAPSGGGLARDSSPFTPTQFPPPGTRPQLRPTPATAGCRASASRPASRPGLATTPWQDLAHPRPAALPSHTPVRPSPGVARRVPASAKRRPAAQ